MRMPKGYASLTWPEGNIEERDAGSCAHCQAIIHIKPFSSPEDAGGYCRRCDKIVCGRCADKGICVPWEKMLAKMEARRSYEDAVQD